MFKWISVAAAALLAAYAALGDTIGPVVAANPKISAVVGVLVVALGYLKGLYTPAPTPKP